MSVELAPLTSRQKKEVLNVVEAYASFWDNTKFRHGWAHPSFTLDQVSPLLELAAEIVVRIRSQLDQTEPGPKLRLTEGSAREYFWKISSAVALKKKRTFVRGLVHATLSDANGFVEGLTAEAIDAVFNSVYDREAIGGKGSKWAVAKNKFSDIIDLMGALDRQLSHEEENNENLDGLLQALTGTESVLQELFKAPEPESEQSADESDSESMELDDDSSVEDSSSESLNFNPSDLRRSDAVVLEIEKISKDANLVQDKVKNLLTATEHLDVDELKADPVEGDKIVSRLHKRALQYSEDLMKDLLSLDEIQTSQSTRPARKAEVVHVQSLIEGVEKIQGKLKTALESIRVEKRISKQEKEAAKKAEAERLEKEKLEKEKKEKEEQEQKERERLEEQEREEQLLQEADEEMERQEHQSEVDAEAEAEAEAEGESEREPMELVPQTNIADLWKTWTLEPKFHVSESRAGYMMKASIPGLDSRTLKVSLGPNQRTLRIQGRRPPTPTDLRILEKQARQYRSRGSRRIADLSDAELLEALAEGEFGVIDTTYRVPENVDPAEITAGYERGVLTIGLPRRRMVPQYAPQYAPNNPWGRRGNYFW